MFINGVISKVIRQDCTVISLFQKDIKVAKKEEFNGSRSNKFLIANNGKNSLQESILIKSGY